MKPAALPPLSPADLALARSFAGDVELDLQQADEAARLAGDLERDRNKAQRKAAENDRRALDLQVQDLRCLGYL